MRRRGSRVGKAHRIGLRTVRLVNEKDGRGESYYFEVNGKPMFAKGSNYIPADMSLPSMTDERYAALFRAIKEANMNMIRVSGAAGLTKTTVSMILPTRTAYWCGRILCLPALLILPIRRF